MQLRAYTVEQAVEGIIPWLEGTGRTAYKAIYFDGWDGLAASSVLRSIAEDPPPSVKKKFDKILRIDCSRWKSPRALQRAIAHELKLPQSIMAAFDREDEDDDFSGVEEGSRAEIGEIRMETYQTIRDLTCLVIFHNGSDSTVNWPNFGFPQFDWFDPCTVLWTFRGRLRLNPEIKQKVDSSHLYIYQPIYWMFDHDTAQLIFNEATEVAKYMQHKQSIIPGIAAKCIEYLLWLSEKGGSTMEYNWATHASNYWVCDGIIEEGQPDESWEVSAALHQQIRLDDYSSLTVNFPDDHPHAESWKSAIYKSDITEKLSPKLTSFFLAVEKSIPLPPHMFQQSGRLRVLKLFGCSFSFYSPPFRSCRSLRFLGLDSCTDQRQEEEGNKGRPTMEFFQSLWVLDISHMDWELDLSQDTLQQMARNIREIHLKKGRVWRSNLAWRQLQNLGKVRVIKLLDLSGSNAIEVLPTLCGATGLRNLVLDGCTELVHVGPGLPPSLESFSFDAGAGENGSDGAKISCITLAGCAKLVDFRLLGYLPNLVELDLSGTAVKFLDLKRVRQVENLQRVCLMGCKQLHAIFWPENGMQQLRLLCIDITDIRFFQSLVEESVDEFAWGTTGPLKLNIYLPCTSMEDDGKNSKKDRLGRTAGHLVGEPSVAPTRTSQTSCPYNDVRIEEIAAFDTRRTSGLQFVPHNIHVEIRQGTINNTNVVAAQVIRAVQFVMNRVQSLHVHNNSSITSIIPDEISRPVSGKDINYRALKWCRLESCPKLDTVFYTNYGGSDLWFDKLENFWAADLLMARSIWSRGRPYHARDAQSFAKLQAIHLYSCRRLQFVLPLSWGHTLSSLETLHIVCCGDLKQVFPVEERFLSAIATEHPNGMLEFPKLKHLYLQDLFCLQQICEAKIFAPVLETVHLRGCWALRRLPATSRYRQDGRLVAVDCERDWWEKLEWDGLRVGHHHSLFAPRHSAYYKKRQLRTTVLR
ncbi:hypothetical protein HU200_053759 [Digitaria exilis]|uniref:Disease resistance protein At4g27190-like leucine-rich repeats domain-containing protein n=1 Tax=Digitaria exilis TaxID=1010633 RepID=A0A835AQY4_9POAL|nr:hypothetical protein HU200_053759 [Digitaria exilis]